MFSVKLSVKHNQRREPEDIGCFDGLPLFDVERNNIEHSANLIRMNRLLLESLVISFVALGSSVVITEIRNILYGSSFEV